MSEKYTVTNQKQVREQTVTGQFVDAMKVDFLTASGVAGWVMVPLSRYNRETVHAMIDERVKAIDDVAGL